MIRTSKKTTKKRTGSSAARRAKSSSRNGKAKASARKGGVKTASRDGSVKTASRRTKNTSSVRAKASTNGRAKSTTARAKSSRQARKYDWADLPEKELLDLRICDLGVNLKTSPVQNRIDQLYEELKSKGIRFRPHCWLSNDWFSPDGVPGIAIPFYLAHPRLARLERKMIHEVEGGTKDWCMRILRHETGHAIDTAYRLRRRRSWREVFGGSSQPYPDHYQPKPYSKNFVLHLDQWYAQSHPTEDFAETFAVWFKQRRRWAKDYHGWPALHKLEYVDEVMEEICREKPLVTTRESIDPIRLLKKTLRRHYNEKRERYGIGYPNSIDGDLRRLFSDAAKHSRRLLAWKFLQRSRAELSKVAVKWTGQHQYAIDQVLREMIDRCRVLKLRLGRSERETKQDVLVLLTVQTMKYLHRGYPRVML